MSPDLIYAIAGALAAFCRAALTDQGTLSRKTAVDVVVGAVSGVLVPLVVDMQPTWSLIRQGAVVFGAGYLSGSLLSLVAAKVPGLGALVAGPVEVKKMEAATAAREAVAAEGKR